MLIFKTIKCPNQTCLEQENLGQFPTGLAIKYNKSGFKIK